MPLERFTVRNEYSLGAKELYNNGVEFEDPKLIVDGVTVSGLVGLLRQLGDLSQFAVEIFHSLQEQVAFTASRSRKLATRVQHVEALLPSVEKAILSQTSHIRFAYSPGSEWHLRIKNEHNHFVCDDLPHFIMDSYEECREPPRLQLLERFDPTGPGSCVKRYSDPNFFTRASFIYEACNRNKSQREMKARKIKKRKPWQHSGRFRNSVILNNNERKQISSHVHQGEPSLPHSGSSYNRSFESDLGDSTDTLGSKMSIKLNKTRNDASSLIVDNTTEDNNKKIDLNEQIFVVTEGIQRSYAADATEHSSSDVTWDEKLEMIERMVLNRVIENAQHVPETNYHQHLRDMTPVSAESIHRVDDLTENGSISNTEADQQFTDSITRAKIVVPSGINSFNGTFAKKFSCEISQVGDLSELTNCTESDSDGHCFPTTLDEKILQLVGRSFLHGQEVKPLNDTKLDHVEDLPQHGSNSELNAEQDSGIGEVQGMYESNLNLNKHGSEQLYSEPLSLVTKLSDGEESCHDDDLVLANRKSFPQVTEISQGENPLLLRTNEDLISDPLHSQLCKGDAQYMLESRYANKWARQRNDDDVTVLSTRAAALSKAEDTPDSTGSNNVASDDQYMLETNIACPQLKAAKINEEYNGPMETSTEEVNTVNQLQWPHHDDIDSETDNFVDALNTIDSESENEYETQTRRQEKASVSIHKLPGNSSTNPVVEKITQSELDLEFNSTMCVADVDRVEIKETSHQSGITRLQQSVESPPILGTVSQGGEHCVNANDIRLKPVESSSQASLNKKTDCELDLSANMPCGSTCSYPHAMWTNGTLFRLQSSKPTVISMSNSARTSSNNDNIVDQCNLEVDDPARTMSSSIKNYDHGDNLDSNCQDNRSLKHVPHDVSDMKYNEPLQLCERNNNDNSVVPGLGNGRSTSHDIEVSFNADLKNVDSEGTDPREDRTSLFSLLGQNLLRNGLRWNESIDYEDKNKPNEPLSAVPMSISWSILNGKLQSPVNSPPPSPPLELMKMSLCPTDSYEISRLKLKYAEARTDNHEITVESFPSFQLVPESAGLQQDMGSDSASDSDDDTFCRSYPCMSDNSMTHLSDSDSEQWETGRTLEIRDHAIYDGLHTNSSKESSSTSFQQDGKDQQKVFVGFRSFKEKYLTSGPTSRSPVSEMKACPNLGLETSDLLDVTPQLPPLPPVQWRVSRPVQDEEVDKPEQGYDGLNHSSDTPILVSAVTYPGPGDAGKLQTKVQESDAVVKQTKVAETKMHHQKQIFTKAVADGKTVDDRQDILHQIRTKSFNLKRTETGQSLYTPSTETSTQISAILQKASAIRQAVGSDGEDSSWSDT